MKTIIRLLTIGAFAGLMAGCSGKKSEAYQESDSIAVMEMVDAVTTTQQNYLTKDSIGSIYIGESINEIHDSVPGLYSHREHGASPDAVTITFSNSNGNQFVAYDFGEGKIDVLSLAGTDIHVQTPAGDLKLGDTFSKVLDLPGVAAEWSGYDDSGMWYWTWEGIWFAPAQDNLTPELSQLLYQSTHEPVKENFSDQITIGFIGTGLPF